MSVRSSGVVVYAGESSPSPVPPEFVDALDRVVVRQAHDRAATFQLVVNADRPVGAAAELPVISAGTVKPGTRVKIGIRLDATLCGVLDGIVSFQELTYAGKGGALTYSVIGEDLSLAMRLEEKATEWPGRSSAQIAREIIANYSRYGLSAKVVDPQQDVTPTVDQWIPQQNATDLAYLRALGRSFGHIFAIRPAASLDASSVAYWGPPAREGTPLPVLTVAAGPAGNVRSIEFGYDAAAAALYRGGSRVDDDTETALPIEPAYALGGLKALASTSGTPPALLRTRAFVEPSRAGTSASAYAAALVQESARSALRARVVVDGLVYGTVVTPASLIAVRGAGDAHDGLYYVERVEHEIARRRYMQSIEMTREGLGSTISKAT